MNHLTVRYKKYFSVDIGQEKLTVTKLSWPMTLENIMKYLVTSVNTLILSSYSDQAVAAVGIAGQIINLMNVFYSAVGTGVMVVISQHLGAGNRERAGRVASVSLAMSACFSVVFMGITYGFHGQILRMMNLDFEWKKEVWNIPDDVYWRNLDMMTQLLDLDGILKTFARELSLGQRMIRFLKQINEECGTTILVTSHDMDDLEQMARRMVLLNQGEIAFDGSFDELRGVLGGFYRISVTTRP